MRPGLGGSWSEETWIWIGFGGEGRGEVGGRRGGWGGLVG